MIVVVVVVVVVVLITLYTILDIIFPSEYGQVSSISAPAGQWNHAYFFFFDHIEPLHFLLECQSARQTEPFTNMDEPFSMMTICICYMYLLYVNKVMSGQRRKKEKRRKKQKQKQKKCCIIFHHHRTMWKCAYMNQNPQFFKKHILCTVYVHSLSLSLLSFTVV
jgi:hypothetical protein